jgi:hypothetical protein
MKDAQWRNLRRREYLRDNRPGSEPIIEVAELLVLQKMKDRGIPPSVSTRTAKSAAVIVAWWAQQVPGAVDDPFDLAGNELPIKASPAMATRRFLVVGSKTEALDDLTAVFGKNETSADFANSIVLDLRSLARILVERAGRPLWSVEKVAD